MDIQRNAYRTEDGYDVLHVAVTLLKMACTAEREARARRGAAQLSRRLGQLNGQVEDFEAAAAVLDSGGMHAAACARRFRDMAERLTGVSPWRPRATSQPGLPD